MKTITYDEQTHRLVPVEPTIKIREAIYQSLGHTDLASDIYRAMLSAAPQPEQVVIGSPLTERKAQSVIDRGYKITGYTLTNEQGHKCIVDMSAVRWFDDGDKFFRMMHPQPESVEVEPVGYMDKRGFDWHMLNNEQTSLTFWRGTDGGKCNTHGAEVMYLYTAPPDYEVIKRQRDELVKALEECRFALGPYDDIKPRDWKTDRERLARAHQSASAALASVKGEQK